MHYDIFNGDADGIFALHQYRLAHPNPTTQKITGVKRDIALLTQVEDVKNCVLTVFDISFDSNRISLGKILDANNSILYFDHHFAGTIQQSRSLKTHIDTSAETCTSIIVNQYLDNAFPLWAVCGAYGDNLHTIAAILQNKLGINETQGKALLELGELFNYNGYGTNVSDLHFQPTDLYHAIQPFSNPFDFIATAPQLVQLREGYASDMARALEQKPIAAPGINRVYIFPNTPWANRISGVFSNMKAREQTQAAHAIITENTKTTLRISVRAPLADRRDADTLCKSFSTGGGRSAAAGINALPTAMLDTFLKTFHALYS